MQINADESLLSASLINKILPNKQIIHNKEYVLNLIRKLVYMLDSSNIKIVFDEYLRPYIYLECLFCAI
ncbi:hypothetical protein FMM56_00010 [Campylobacter sp. LR264d]|uniref:hypothetical protein n=1 Tax=Campylobacter sp. LR264d TaxID=2593544 RepID=UPI00123868D7|nr:hypothetical protein [Campylobacter sp. LR264d]KAA6234437.1 hypothetical protein FMM56_00010 [Campylobacter sp. LR264d]